MTNEQQIQGTEVVDRIEVLQDLYPGKILIVITKIDHDTPSIVDEFLQDIDSGREERDDNIFKRIKKKFSKRFSN